MTETDAVAALRELVACDTLLTRMVEIRKVYGVKSMPKHEYFALGNELQAASDEYERRQPLAWEAARQALSRVIPTATNESNVDGVAGRAGDLVPDPVVRAALNAYEQIGSHYEGIKAVVAIVRGRTETFVDQIDAEQTARTWITALVPEGPERAFWHYESLSFSPQDGRVHILRSRDRIVAIAVIVRDSFNRSNLIRWRPAAAPTSVGPAREYTMGDWQRDLDNPHGGR